MLTEHTDVTETRPEKLRSKGFNPQSSAKENGIQEDFYPCSSILRETDEATGIQFLNCEIDYTRCTNTRCIRKLV